MLHRRYFATLLLALGALHLTWMPCDSSLAQKATIWLNRPGSTDWFDPLNWSNGVPNSPGDIARLLQPTGSLVSPNLATPATVGELFFYRTGDVTLTGAGPLQFDNPGDAPAQIYASRGRVNATVEVPISIAEGEQLNVNLASGKTLDLQGGIISATGDITKQGRGTLTLSGDSSAWGGAMIVEEGELILSHEFALGNTLGNTTVDSGALLTFQASSNKAIRLSGGRVQGDLLVLSGPLFLASSSEIGWTLDNPTPLGIGGNPRPLPRGERLLTISGTISGPGDLHLRSDTDYETIISGESNYTGHTYISEGKFIAATSTSFGANSAGTTISGGILTLQATTQEPIRIEDGILRFKTSDMDSQAAITLAGGRVEFPFVANNPTPVIIDSPNAELWGSWSGSKADLWTGGSSGTGNLKLLGRINVNAPLTHDGNLEVRYASLNVANSYTGTTTVTGMAFINHPGALGTSTTPIVVNEGYLTLNAIPRGNRKYIIQRGTLDVPASTQPISSEIELGTDWQGFIDGSGVFEGAINYTSHPGGGDAHIGGGTFNGPIRGNGLLRLGTKDAEVILNSANDIGGIARILGNVTVNHVQAIEQSNTVLETGVLHMNVPVTSPILMTGASYNAKVGTLDLRVPQDFSKPWVMHSGWIDPSVEVGFSQLILLSGNGVVGIDSKNGGTVRIDGELRVMGSGSIQGGISGKGDIKIFGNYLGVSGDLTDFHGNYLVKNGSMTLGRTSEGFSDRIALAPDSKLHIYQGGYVNFFPPNQDFVLENDIFLHNANHSISAATSSAFIGGNYAHTVTLQGRLDVGDQGSTTSGSLRIEGPLTGRNLTHQGGGIVIATPQSQLQGVLRLSDSALSFSGAGKISGLASILLDSSSLGGSRSGRGSLNIGQDSISGITDRVADDLPIYSRGGQISFTSRQTNAIEMLGTLYLEQGKTDVAVSVGNGSLASNLVINKVVREKGTLLHTNLTGNDSKLLQIKDVSSYDGHMLGAWAVTRNAREFASIDGNGFIGTVSPTSSDLGTASPMDHVAYRGSHTLSGDKAILSLALQPTGDAGNTLDLNGHQLNIRSGGLLRSPEITNGKLTAGDGEDTELIVHNTYRISADIIDNPLGGSVALVLPNASNLTGNNTYTGGTWITGGELTILDRSAIPANDRVHINNGTYDLTQISGNPIRLGEIHLSGNGDLDSRQAPINANKYFLNSGQLAAELSGSGTIIKDSDQLLKLHMVNGSPAYKGTLIIRNGRVQINPDGTRHRIQPLPNAKIAIEGGMLEATLDNDITLKGGTLGPGSYSGSINVQENSRIISTDYTILRGELRGTGDIIIDGRIALSDSSYRRNFVGIYGGTSDFSGDFLVKSGALRLGATREGTPTRGGTGSIFVEAGARLILGSSGTYSLPTLITNDIHLSGGTLAATPPSDVGTPAFPPGTVAGDVFVHEDAYIGAMNNGLSADNEVLPGLTLAGTVHLPSNSNVFGLSSLKNSFLNSVSDRLVDVSGVLSVGHNTTWSLLTSKLTVTGTIESDAADASINFVGLNNWLQLDGVNLSVQKGQSLSVLVNGDQHEMHLTGSSKRLTGNGTLGNSVTLTEGAAISPGNSAGLLTVDGDVTLVSGGRFVVELGGTLRGDEYDALNVTGKMLIGGFLDLSLIDGFIPAPDQEFVILQADHIDGRFSNAAESITVAGIQLPITYFDDRVILGNAMMVPEPASVALLLLGFVGLAFARRRGLKAH